MDIIGVPIEIGYGAVVLTSVEHDQIKQTADAEAAPDAEVVVHLDLTNGHPFKVGTHRVHLALVYRDTAIADERSLGVVKLGSSIAVGVI